jgi:hypothetical protein
VIRWAYQEFRVQAGGWTSAGQGAGEALAEAHGELGLGHRRSRDGIFHSLSVRFKTRESSFTTAFPGGKWPLALTAHRSLELSASIAFVTGMMLVVPPRPAGIARSSRMV